MLKIFSRELKQWAEESRKKGSGWKFVKAMDGDRLDFWFGQLTCFVLMLFSNTIYNYCDTYERSFVHAFERQAAVNGSDTISSLRSSFKAQ